MTPVQISETTHRDQVATQRGRGGRLSLMLGTFTLAGVGALIAWDAFPQRFPAGSHDVLAAFPLAMIAFAYLIYRSVQRPTIGEWVRVIILASAFLFWAANQLWPARRQALLFNDVAIGLFVADVFLVMIDWPHPQNAPRIPRRKSAEY